MAKLAVVPGKTGKGLGKRRLVRGTGANDEPVLTSRVMAGIDTKNIGKPLLAKGMYGGYPVVMWDAVPMCKGMGCSLGIACPYFIARGGVVTGYRCDLETRYLAYVYDTLTAVMPATKLTPDVMHSIGLFVIPLYHHLIKFKKAEYGLKSVCDVTGKVSPIYKEMREIMRTIRGFMVDIVTKTGAGLSPVEAGEVVDTAILYGDRNYYDAMSSVGEKSSGVGN